jgi:hypothetical protein
MPGSLAQATLATAHPRSAQLLCLLACWPPTLYPPTHPASPVEAPVKAVQLGHVRPATSRRRHHRVDVHLALAHPVKQLVADLQTKQTVQVQTLLQSNRDRKHKSACSALPLSRFSLCSSCPVRSFSYRPSQVGLANPTQPTSNIGSTTIATVG